MKTRTARLLLVIGGLFVGVLAAEGVARVVPAPGGAQLLMSAPENAPDRLYSVDHELGNLPTPGFDGMSRSPGYAAHIQINRYGLRGGDPGPHDRPRWLVAGDSFTFAAQVNQKVSFVGRLELDRQWLHGGADGWSTWQPALLYKRLDPVLTLDGLVVVFFLGNDLSDNANIRRNLDNARRQPNGKALDMPPTAAWRTFLSRRSTLWGFAQMHRREADFGDARSPERSRWADELRPFTTAGTSVPLLRETEGALRFLQASVGTDPLLVAIAPPPFAVDPARLEATWTLVGLDPKLARPAQPRDQVLDMLERLRISACDLTPPLEASVRAGEDPYFTYDGHWNTLGHELVAARLTECLAE